MKGTQISGERGISDAEIKLRLIEAAAQLPVVRASMDDKLASAKAHAIAKVWYTNFVKDDFSKTGKPDKAPGWKNRN